MLDHIANRMRIMMTTQDPWTNAQLQALQTSEASLVKQLATAEAKMKSYQNEYSAMSSSERELNIGVRQNRQAKVMGLRGELDNVRQQIAELRSGVSSDPGQGIVRMENGPVILSDAPAVVVGSTESPHYFGLEPRQLREPAAFILLLPLVLVLCRWIWRRSSDRPTRVHSLEGNPQINRLEQAVEAIAIEVERISEAQRFSAKLMAERPKESVIERIREPVKGQRRVVTPLP